MMRPAISILAAVVWCSAAWAAPESGEGAAAPVAPGAARAGSLDELLEAVRASNQEESAETQRRLAEFEKQRAQQQALLAAALAEQAKEERRSDDLKALYDENEKAIPELQEKLRERMGTLGEVFGVARQVAGDTRSQFENSLISAQLPGREEFLTTLGESSENPTIDDLERVWFLLQQHMTEQGKVVRFSANVVSSAGGEQVTDVVRVGPFNAVAGGKYLNYVPETAKLGELARQPQSRHLNSAAALEAAKQPIGFALDPSRGSILAKLIQAPSLEERIEQGGAVGYVIIGLGAVGLLLAVYRLVYLWVTGRKIRWQLGREEADAGNPLGRVLGVYSRNRDADLDALELKLDEAIMKETPGLERGEALIKVLSVVAPLLGLLGTVTGMIQTFQAITLFGTGDPKMMADGISQALVTTVLGLCMAIPLTMLYSIVSSYSASLAQILEEQSAGLIAERADRIEEQPTELRHAVAG